SGGNRREPAVGLQIERPWDGRRRPALRRSPGLRHHGEVVDGWFGPHPVIPTPQVMVEEAEQLGGLIEAHGRREGGRAYLTAAAMVPRPEDESMRRLAERQVAFDGGELIRAVEPAAGAVHGRPGCADVSSEGVRAEAVCRTWGAPRNVVAIDDVLGPGMWIVVVRVLTDGGGAENKIVIFVNRASPHESTA